MADFSIEALGMTRSASVFVNGDSASTFYSP
jgi:hypothetical protein